MPRDVEKDWTVIVLALSVTDREFELVRTALQDIRLEMLLFTRRLRQIQISLQPGPSIDGRDEDTDEGPYAETYEEKIYRVTAEARDPSELVSTINPQFANIGDRRYFRQERHISDMPYHKKRQNSKESKIVLAFPFNDNGPIIGEQHIFAFLPLRRIPLPVLPHIAHTD